MSAYEIQRKKTMQENERHLAEVLCHVKINKTVHVPASAFPDYEAPPEGYWVGKTCRTKQGGCADIGINIPGEPIFTIAMTTAAKWLVH